MASQETSTFLPLRISKMKQTSLQLIKYEKVRSAKKCLKMLRGPGTRDLLYKSFA